MRSEIGAFGVWRMASAVTPELAEQVEEHRYRYYVLDRPTASDAEFDERETFGLDPDWKVPGFSQAHPHVPEIDTAWTRLTAMDRQAAAFLEIQVRPGARSNLGRPTLSPPAMRDLFRKHVTASKSSL